MASRKDGALYIGVTSDLIKRVYQHKEGLIDGHTAKYDIKNLVYYEQHEDVEQAILREKQLKVWKRQWKIELLEKHNPSWNDLYPEICGAIPA
jgi:putative endonuclease